MQALHILNSHEIIALNNILYTFAFCLSEPNFKTVSKDRFEIATCEFQFNPNIRASDARCASVIEGIFRDALKNPTFLAVQDSSISDIVGLSV